MLIHYFLITLTLITITLSQNSNNFFGNYSSLCPSNCAYCPKSQFSCQACLQGFERSEMGQCIPDRTVNYCHQYTRGNNCRSCKPAYRLFNICVAMYDGCLISGSEAICTKCIEGAILSQFGRCNSRYINCLNISNDGQCSKCDKLYRLQNGRCINSQVQCRQTNKETGLCLNCADPKILHNYICMGRQQVFENCDLMDKSDKKCIYCKSGYDHYNGQCKLWPQITKIVYGPNVPQDFHCPISKYYNSNSNRCSEIPLDCQKFDHGLQKCMFCKNRMILIDGLCRDGSLKFCQKFRENDYKSCEQCMPKFFLTPKNLCEPYPMFCQKISGQICVKCIEHFLLNEKQLCQDPNCMKFDQITNQCLQCLSSYQINQTTRICQFKDLYCVQNDPIFSDICLQCKIDYKYSDIQKKCIFIDPDCQAFSKQQICIRCKSGFYLNRQSNVCINLPQKCILADQFGRCRQCDQDYALTTSYECQFIPNLDNCEQISSINNKECAKCKQGLYVNKINGKCQQLPFMCQQFNSIQNQCKKCQNNALLKNGRCNDRNCEIYGNNFECFACKEGFAFNRLGQCIKQTRDPNCKKFQNGLCKECSQFHYFDKNWNCIKVHSLCKEYNINNGKCTSCHSGYQIEKGLCVKSTQKKQTCLKKDGLLKCQSCIKGYYIFQGQCYDYIVGCLQLDPISKLCTRCSNNFEMISGLCYSDLIETIIQKKTDKNCLQFDRDNQTCKKCISRMFYSPISKVCVNIDPNCEEFNSTSGVCLLCYSGYVVSQTNSLQCDKAKPKDPNCKISNPNDPQICNQCYAGFFYSQTNQQCEQTNPQCQTTDQSNGKCSSCWDGYGLKNGECIYITNCISYQNGQCLQCFTGYQLKQGECLLQQVQDFQAINNQEFLQKNTDIRCIRYSQIDPLKCSQCITGSVFDEVSKKCEYPHYGEDKNCQVYQKGFCTKCKSGTLLSNFKCIFIDFNCIQFTQDMKSCVKCRQGYYPQQLVCLQK